MLIFITYHIISINSLIVSYLHLCHLLAYWFKSFVKFFYIGSYLGVLIVNLIDLSSYATISSLQKFEWRSSAHWLIRFNRRWLLLWSILVLGGVVVSSYARFPFTVSLLTRFVGRLRIGSTLVACDRWRSHSWS